MKFGMGVIVKSCEASVNFVKIGSVRVVPFWRG